MFNPGPDPTVTLLFDRDLEPKDDADNDGFSAFNGLEPLTVVAWDSGEASPTSVQVHLAPGTLACDNIRYSGVGCTIQELGEGLCADPFSIDLPFG